MSHMLEWLLATMLLREARAREVPLTAPMSTWPQAPSWATGEVADITLRDLQAVAASFKATLRAVYHPRVAYPSPTPEEIATLARGETPVAP